MPVEMLVDTGNRLTRALLERLRVPVASTQRRTLIRLDGKEFSTPVTFGENGEQNLPGTMALEDTMMAVDPHSRRLAPVDALEMTSKAV